MQKIKIAENDEEIRCCYSVMKQLRPKFQPDDFLKQVKRQMAEGKFNLVYLDENGVKAAGTYRLGEWLAGGRYLEIEDLVTEGGERSKGYGSDLFDWLMDFAKQQKCDQIKLVSHVTRFGAHRFYLNKKMIIEAHYFSMTL